jgi:hypothetical protein
MEARLKDDILREAERYAGAIMVNHETSDGQIFDAWEPVGPGAVQTPLLVPPEVSPRIAGAQRSGVL